MTLAESAVLTAILTHGYFAAIVLSVLAPRDGWRQRGAVVETALHADSGRIAGTPVEAKT